MGAFSCQSVKKRLDTVLYIEVRNESNEVGFRKTSFCYLDKYFFTSINPITARCFGRVGNQRFPLSPRTALGSGVRSDASKNDRDPGEFPRLPRRGEYGCISPDLGLMTEHLPYYARAASPPLGAFPLSI